MMKQPGNEPEGGIYIERKVFYSAAYQALSKNGRMVLIAMLDARQINPAYKKAVKKGFRADRYVDLDKIRMPYTKLRDVYGVSIQRIPTAIDELLAKGFVEIKHPGGAGEHDMTVYALVEDYLRWTKGEVFRQRQRDIRRGYQGRRGLGATAPIGDKQKLSRSKTESYTRSKTESSRTRKRSL